MAELPDATGEVNDTDGFEEGAVVALVGNEKTPAAGCEVEDLPGKVGKSTGALSAFWPGCFSKPTDAGVAFASSVVFSNAAGDFAMPNENAVLDGGGVRLPPDCFAISSAAASAAAWDDAAFACRKAAPQPPAPPDRDKKRELTTSPLCNTVQHQ